MFALKIFGDPRPGLWCALARLGQTQVCKILSGQHPYGPKYGLPKKSIWVVPNSHVLLSG